MKFRNNKKGFTLIELIMVIVIIGILSAVAIPTFANLVRQARIGATQGSLGAVRSALAIAYAQSAAVPANGGIATYPAALAGANFADGQIPLNSLTNVRNIATVAGAGIPIDDASCVLPAGGFWYVQATGRSGAYTDIAEAGSFGW